MLVKIMRDCDVLVDNIDSMRSFDGVCLVRDVSITC